MHYSVLSAADFELLETSVICTTLAPVYHAIQNNPKDKRPRRGALTYLPECTDLGLSNVNAMNHLWGTKQEIAEYNKKAIAHNNT